MRITSNHAAFHLGGDQRMNLKWLRRRSLAIAIAGGIALMLGGAGLGVGTLLGAVMLSIGGSLFGAAAYSWLVQPKDDLLESFHQHGVLRVFSSRAEELTNSEWEQLVEGVSLHYRALGGAHHGYMSTAPRWEKFRSLFRAAVADRRVSVDLLWLKPDCALAIMRENEEGRSTRDDAIDSIQRFFELWQSLPDDARGRFGLYEYEKTPSCSVVWADETVWVTQYLPARADVFGPGLMLEQPRSRRRRRGLPQGAADTHRDVTPLVSIYTEIFQEVKSTASKITAERVEQLSAYRSSLPSGRKSEADLRRRVEKGE
jgi:hypothetical protein